MPNTPSISLRKFECRLVNSFGDGHNHELAQYEACASAMKRIAAEKGFDGILLGNVYCDNVSLDSLLLTSFGVFVIEFKSYPKAATVRITGQKEFQCLNPNGERMIGPNGDYLNVKGGSLANPYEQSKKNRIAVFNTLKSLFGEEKARAIHIGVAIVFDGRLTIEGIDNIIEAERRWLTVVDSHGFERFIAYMAGEQKNGLYPADRQVLISKIEANKAVVEKADPFQQGMEYLRMENYRDAYYMALNCDPLNPDVIALKLIATYRCNGSTKFSSIFNKLVVENSNSSDQRLRELSNKLLGYSFLHGIHGHKQSDDKALEYLERSGSKSEDVVNYIKMLKERIKQAQAEEYFTNALREAMKESAEKEAAFKSKNSEVIKEAGNHYQVAGRIMKTALTVCVLCYIAVILIPAKGINIFAPITALLYIIGMLLWINAKRTSDVWCVAKTGLKHSNEMSFTTVSMRSRFFLKGDRLYKTLGLIVAIAGYFILPMYLCCRIAKLSIDYLLSFGSIQHGIDKIADYTSLNPTFLFQSILLTYCVINVCGLGYLMYSWFFNDKYFQDAVHDGKADCFLIAMPHIRKDFSYRMESSIWLLCKEGVAFSFRMTVVLCILGVLKPYIHTLVSLLF